MGLLFGSLLTVAGLFCGMLLAFEVGRRVGVRHMRMDAEGAHSGTNAVQSAVFGLLALLVGFTFLGAANRFDRKRDFIIEETNLIGTAYMRLDILPVEQRTAIEQAFRNYVDARLDFARHLGTESELVENTEKVRALQLEIWKDAIAVLHTNPDAARLLLPPLSDMFDIANTRMIAPQMHPPAIIFVMLFGFSFASALLAGHAMAKSRIRNWLYIVGFATVLSVSVYIILDMEYPRFGLIRIDSFDQGLIDLRRTMH
jgi:hypothetical protein